MKRIAAFFLSLLILASITVSDVSHTFASSILAGVSLSVNGQRITLDVPPVIINGRTMVPVRGITEKLGADVQWIGEEQKVVVQYKNTTIALWINKKQYSVNGVTKTMDAVPYITDGRTLVPLRFLAESMGMVVQYYGPSVLVTVTDPAYFRQLGDKTVLGFTTDDYAGDTYSLTSLKNNYQNLSSVATFSYQFDTSGNLKLLGNSQQDTVSFVNNNGLRPLMLIHNLVEQSGFNAGLAHTVLSNYTKRTNLENNILLKVAKEGYSGVNVDIENTYGSDRPYYSAFISELKAKLSPYGFLTTVSIPAKTSDMKGSNWNGAYDYAAIGKSADQILLMTYDEHYFGGPAGPIASAPWVQNVLNYATSVIPSQKILLGIAGYGYDWSSAGTRVVTFQGVERVLAQGLAQDQWDDTAKAPYYQYTENGVQHTVWYENSQSVAYKTGLVKQYNLGGIGVWKLGYDNSNFWAAVQQNLG